MKPNGYSLQQKSRDDDSKESIVKGQAQILESKMKPPVTQSQSWQGVRSLTPLYAFALSLYPIVYSIDSPSRWQLVLRQ